MSGKAPPPPTGGFVYGIKVPSTVYGTPITVAYGRCRIAGNVLWTGHYPDGFTSSNLLLGSLPSDFASLSPVIAGFGGAVPLQTQPSYFVSLDWGLCEGPIVGVRTLYKRDTRFVINQINLDAFDRGLAQTPPYSELFAFQDDDGTIVSRYSNETNLRWSPIHIFRGQAGQPAWTDIWDPAIPLAADRGGLVFTFHYVFKPPKPVVSYPYLAHLARHAWPIYQNTDLPGLEVERFGLSEERR